MLQRLLAVEHHPDVSVVETQHPRQKLEVAIRKRCGRVGEESRDTGTKFCTIKEL